MGFKLDISRSFKVVETVHQMLLDLSSILTVTTSSVTLSKLTSLNFNYFIYKIGIIIPASKVILRIK